MASNSLSNGKGSRIPTDHALIGQAEKIPTTTPSPVLSISPVVLSAPDRILDLQLRVSAPSTGQNLPIILLSHGHGPSNNLSSLNGYAPIANFWAAHGFVVIQPTHLSSRSLSLDPTTPGAPLFWKSRVEDMKHILDHLDDIEIAAPFIKGRLDRDRIALAGHSLGGHTASVLLGARVTDPNDGTVFDMIEPRIKAGVLLTPPGNGDKDLSKFAYESYKDLRHISFAEMKIPALVVVGDDDLSPHLTVRGADWHADAYTLSSGSKSLLTLHGAKHGLGGIAAYDAAETNDESPKRVAVVQRLTLAYLRSQLYSGDPAWSAACQALEGLKEIGWVKNK